MDLSRLTAILLLVAACSSGDRMPYQVEVTGQGRAFARCDPGDRVVTGGCHLEKGCILGNSPKADAYQQGWECSDGWGGPVTARATCEGLSLK